MKIFRNKRYLAAGKATGPFILIIKPCIDPYFLGCTDSSIHHLPPFGTHVFGQQSSATVQETSSKTSLLEAPDLTDHFGGIQLVIKRIERGRAVFNRWVEKDICINKSVGSLRLCTSSHH